ncbi:hypothetical protein AVEN_257509-1 [Araneus ventricosus]|uniref:Uncharacterized protein n=1 Tax=Araneus ventricosus TaxID=182803 RepID=A0A4Y2SGP4_ARAVE|nr:hypothetical protein AVEN_257509-1 [Araneus ventricosus]
MFLNNRTSYMSRSEDLWKELGYFLIFLQLSECRISCNVRRNAISVRVHHATRYMDFMFGMFPVLNPLASRTRKMQIIPSAHGFPLRPYVTHQNSVFTSIRDGRYRSNMESSS